MKTWISLAVFAALISGPVDAQQSIFTQNDGAMRELEAQSERFRQLSERSRQETERIQQETERLQRDTERLRNQMNLMESQRQTQETLNQMGSKPSSWEQHTKEMADYRAQKEAEKAAKESAEQLLYQNAVASAQSRNQMLYLFLILASAAAIGLVIHKRKGQKLMTAQEKSGVLAMTLAAVLPFVSLLFTVSPWSDTRDVLGNLFHADVIIGGETVSYGVIDPLLKFPISWLIFAAVLLGAYGFLLFTNVVKAPAWLCKQLETEQSKTPDAVVSGSESKVD